MTPVGLIAAGSAARSPIARFLPGHLGPVKSGSLRVAGRLAGSLRAGFAVKGYEDLAPASAILICVPEEMVPELVAGLAASSLDLDGRIVVLCDSDRDSAELAILSAAGAYVASLNEAHDFFVAEGDRAATRFIRGFLALHRERVLELNPGSKALFLTGLAFAGGLLTPLAAAAVSSFQLAGLERAQAVKLMQRAFDRSIRSFIAVGKKNWTSPLQPDSLEGHDPALAEYLRRSTESALRLFADG